MIDLKYVHWRRTPLEFLVQVSARYRGADGGSMNSGKGLPGSLCSSSPESCRPRHGTSPSGSRSLLCQDLNRSRAKEANFSTTAKFCDLTLRVRTAIVNASRPCLSSVTDPVGPHHITECPLFSPSPTGLPGRGK